MTRTTILCFPWVLDNVPQWNFPQDISINPGDALLFVGDLGQTKATVFMSGQDNYTFDLVRNLPANTPLESAGLAAHSDDYLPRMLALAHEHALMGSTKEQFHKALAESDIKNTANLQKLTNGQFKAVNAANATVQLQGDQSVAEDQSQFDEAAMLACSFNTRLAAMANAQDPNSYDISTPEGQLDIINNVALKLFNWYHVNMGPYLTTVKMSWNGFKNNYSTATIQHDAMSDVFQSLALPESALTQLLGAANSFVAQMRGISSKIGDKTRANAKLVKFFSIQPPLGSLNLPHVTKMRMIYCQFNDATSAWTSGCASGPNYTLSINAFALDCELNSQIVHLVYDKW
ncbi:hypothetical protein B0I35DRAFT_500699 [Stachybotrys elegans]|uniref:Uncharacterized protein n=1 Tax=Stachybotrys elegans TaxID=80388 RepID=A0A8K0SS49_9HYPO|nr:hypothetical protein B0I35DRAFT_500699 [Stachybotrys elegans]